MFRCGTGRKSAVAAAPSRTHDGKTPVRVFLVDDHPVVREGIRRLLEPEKGIVVVGEAATAEESFGKLDAQAVDVVLMDIRLTGMDGIEATRRLKVKHSDLKVIILSSFGRAYLDQAIEAGASGYILKSATRLELAKAVVQAAGGQFAIDPELTKYLVDRSTRQNLSSRQREILRLIADGMPSSEIERTISVSHATLARELRRIFDLLGVNDRAHAVAEALKRGLL